MIGENYNAINSNNVEEENNVQTSPVEEQVSLSNKRKISLWLFQKLMTCTEIPHRAVNGAVAGVIGTLLIEHFLGFYDLNPESISTSQYNTALLTASLTLTCVAYLRTAPNVNDVVAELNPESDLRDLSNIQKFKDIIKHRKSNNLTQKEYDQKIEDLRICIEYLITAAAINESKTLKYFLAGMRYAAPCFELMLGALSGIVLNGLLVNYIMPLTGNKELLNPSQQIKYVGAYCFVPGLAALSKLALKNLACTSIKLNPSHDSKTQKLNFTIDDGKRNAFDSLKEFFPDLKKKDLPKLKAWDWGAMGALILFNTFGNIGMSSWWLPVLFSFSIKKKLLMKIVVASFSLLTASKEIKYFSIHSLKVKALKMIASEIPNKYQKEAEILKKNPLHGIRYINFNSVETLLGILIGTVILSLLQTMGISDTFPNFTESKRFNRSELMLIYGGFLICNLFILLMNASRAASTKKFVESLRKISPDSSSDNESVVIKMPSAIASGNQVEIETKESENSKKNGYTSEIAVSASNSMAGSTTVAMEVKPPNTSQAEAMSTPFADTQRNSLVEISQSPKLSTKSETDPLLLKNKYDKNTGCNLL